MDLALNNLQRLICHKTQQTKHLMLTFTFLCCYYLFIFLPQLYIKYLGLWVECLPVVWETWVQSQVTSYQKTLKMVLNTSLLNIQQYKVRMKGKVKQFRERSSVPLYTEVAIEKGAFWSPSATVANFTYYIIDILM